MVPIGAGNERFTMKTWAIDSNNNNHATTQTIKYCQTGWPVPSLWQNIKTTLKEIKTLHQLYIIPASYKTLEII